MKQQLKDWSENLSGFHKVLITAFTIIAFIGVSVVGGIRYTVETIREIQGEADEAEMNEWRQMLAALNVVTYDDLRPDLDSIFLSMQLNYAMDSAMHMRTLKRQDVIIVTLEDMMALDDRLVIRLDTIENYIRKVSGYSEISLREQRLLAREDSLRTVLILARQKEFNHDRMKQLEQQHYESMQEIREFSQQKVVDAHRKKTARIKPKRKPIGGGRKMIDL